MTISSSLRLDRTLADNNGDGIDDVTGLPVSSAGVTIPSSVANAAGQYGINPQLLGNLPGLTSGQVYMGTKKVGGDTLSAGGRGPITRQTIRDTLSLEDAQNLPLTWTQKQQDDFVRSLVLKKYPGADPNMGLPEIGKAWNDLVTVAQQAQQAGSDLSPWDILNSYKSRAGMTYKRGNWEYDAATNQPIRYIGPKSKTTTSTTINTLTREDALALTKSSMAQLLGRAPTDSEVSKYMGILNGLAEQNPQVTTTTSTIDDQGVSSEKSSKTTGGISQAGLQAAAEQQIEKTPEYGAYQASTTYMNALLQLLGG